MSVSMHNKTILHHGTNTATYIVKLPIFIAKNLEGLVINIVNHCHIFDFRHNAKIDRQRL